MSKYRIIVVICLCSILAAMPASGQSAGRKNSYESAVNKARSEIWQAINSGKCGSATVAIMVDGRIVYAEGFGMADREKSIPVTPATIFNIGSISKTYVAAAIMLLVDDGKVSLDRPVAEYLPEFRMADHRYRKITVRMLLNHQSGIPGTMGWHQVGFKYNDDVKRETVNALTHAHLKHAPGAMAVYCNDGFTLAEMIVERVSGSRYIDFLSKRIFKPLGLKNTGMGVGEIKGKPVASYYDAKTGKKHPHEVLSVLAAGGLSATAVDLCLFADAFSAKSKLLTASSLAGMKKAQYPEFWNKLRNSEVPFGLGWDMTGVPRYDKAGIQILGKSGGTGYYSSMLFTVPDKRISVALIASGSDSGAMKIAVDVLDAVLVEQKLVSKEEISLPVPPAAQKLPQDHASFSGYYATGSTVAQAVFNADKNSAVLYSLRGQDKTPAMALVYNNGYYHDARGNRYYFIDTEGETYLVAYLPAVRVDKIVMQKVKPIEKPRNLKISMDGRLWLRRNVSPYESDVTDESHFVKSWVYKDLPGYVYFQGLKRVESAEFAGMHLNAVRDLTELTLVEKSGTTWARVMDILYSPAASAAALKAGENSVKIGSDGYSEWLFANEGMVLSFVKPEKGRIIIFSADGGTIYDSAVDNGDVYVSAGSYIECAGFLNDVFKIKSRTASIGGNK